MVVNNKTLYNSDNSKCLIETILNEANQIYIGQCDRIRRTTEGEDFWQELMKNKKIISKNNFLSKINPSNILDDDESIDDFIVSDKDSYFAKSIVNKKIYYFIGTSGFEFIWEIKNTLIESYDTVKVYSLSEKILKEVGDLSNIAATKFKRVFPTMYTATVGDENLNVSMQPGTFPKSYSCVFTINNNLNQAERTDFKFFMNVLKTVSDIVFDFINKKKPDVLYFTGNDKDSSFNGDNNNTKSKIYKKIIQQNLNKIPNYSVAEVEFSENEPIETCIYKTSIESKINPYIVNNLVENIILENAINNNFGDKRIETDNAIIEGYYGDEVFIDDETVKLPQIGFLISDIFLKNGAAKGKGAGQEIYIKALNKYGILYSTHPISEDALNAQNALEKKGFVTIEYKNIGGSDFRVIKKKINESKKVLKEDIGDANALKQFHELRGTKVADKNGNPIAVHHGTNADFKEFSKDKLGSKNFLADSAYQGFFFAGTDETAKAYTGMNSSDFFGMQISGDKKIDEIGAKYSKEQKVIDDKNKKIKEEENKKYEEATKDFSDTLKEIGITSEKDINNIKAGSPQHLQMINAISDRYIKEIEPEQKELNKKKFADLEKYHIQKRGLKPRIIKAYLDIKNPYIYDYNGKEEDTAEEGLTSHIARAKKNGNDGVIFKNLADGANKDNIYVVFDPKQIKQISETKLSEGKNNRTSIVYHGTNKYFVDFKPNGLGIHFGTKEQAADRGKKIIESEIDIKNPFRMDDMGSDFDMARLSDELLDAGLIDKTKKQNLINKGNPKDVVNILKKNGYDGIIYKNRNENKSNPQDSYIVFSKSQIKTKIKESNTNVGVDKIKIVKNKEDLGNTILYHGTVKEGFEDKNSDYIFFTPDKEVALKHANDRAESMEAEDGKKGTPIIVSTTADKIKHLGWLPDNDEGLAPYKTWQESYNGWGSFIAKGKYNIKDFTIEEVKSKTPITETKKNNSIAIEGSGRTLKDIVSTAEALRIKFVNSGIKTPNDIPNTLGTYLQNLTDGSWLIRDGDTTENWAEFVDKFIKKIENILKSVPYPKSVKDLFTKIKNNVSEKNYNISDLVSDFSEKTKRAFKGNGDGWGYYEISKAYHKAKSDGTNPELVVAVEKQLKNKSILETTSVQEVDGRTLIKNLIEEILKESGEVYLNRNIPDTTETIVYSAVFFDKKLLIRKYGSVYPNVYAGHSTIQFKPKDISNLPIGKKLNIKVLGRLTTSKVDVLIVENKLSTRKFPHITLSTANGVTPSESNDEIEKNKNLIVKMNGILKGTVGVYAN